jgi:hypothetical protein
VEPEEQYARSLKRLLSDAVKGNAAVVKTSGAKVDFSLGPRRCRIDCFDYGDLAGTLVIGLRGNAHLSKVNIGPDPLSCKGAEYLTIFLVNEGDAIFRQFQGFVAKLTDLLPAGFFHDLAPPRFLHKLFIQSHSRAWL